VIFFIIFLFLIVSQARVQGRSGRGIPFCLSHGVITGSLFLDGADCARTRFISMINNQFSFGG
jgi:hypothetical protein